MADIKLFRISDKSVEELRGSSVALEKSLQTLIEHNLATLLGVTFLASEYATGPKYGGRIDTLGIDENRSPVIVEYKRALNENVINQGLFYLDWLMDHKAEFQLLVQRNLGTEAAEGIDWAAPRLICIAGDFTRYDVHAVQQIHRNIELIRYRRFGDDLLLLELVNAPSATASVSASMPQPSTAAPASGRSASPEKTVSEILADLTGPLRDLYEELRAYLFALGDDVQEKVLKHYVAYRRMKNFACVEIHPAKKALTVYVKVDPSTVELVPGFTRDVRAIGHWGTGDLEITLRSSDDLRRAKDLIDVSYDAS
ncbi:MAG: DUF91 domain-containing protein [Firmicutes bacterium]|nr:DUF91 domain-containing protein [Bacillota bacterium]